jgi:hypothetical protein
MPGGFWLAFHQHGITWISIILEASCIYHEYGFVCAPDKNQLHLSIIFAPLTCQNLFLYRRKRVELPIWIGFIGVYLTWNLAVSISTGVRVFPRL